MLQQFIGSTTQHGIVDLGCCYYRKMPNSDYALMSHAGQNTRLLLSPGMAQRIPRFKINQYIVDHEVLQCVQLVQTGVAKLGRIGKCWPKYRDVNNIFG